MIVCLDIGYESYSLDIGAIRNGIIQTINYDFDAKANQLYVSATDKNNCINLTEACKNIWLTEVSRTARLEIDFKKLVNEIDSYDLKSIYALQGIVIIIILGIPLTISLVISFHITLWMLGSVTKSSLRCS